MKALDLNEMELVEGGGLLRNYLLVGTNTLLGIATIPWGGSWYAIGAISTATALGCFDY